MERQSGNRFVLLSVIAMELCWLHFLTAFLLDNLFRLHTPLLFALILYLGGTLVTLFSRRKRRLVISHLFIQALSYSVLLIATIHFFIYEANNRPRHLANQQLFSIDKSTAEWLSMVLLVVLSLLIWKRGSVAVSQPLGTSNMYHRFDLGITVFVVLLVISSLLMVRFETPVRLNSPEFQFIPFILFGLLSIGLTVVSGEKTKSFASGFHKIGIALVFTAFVAVAGLGLVLLFTPQLTTTAENLSVILKKAGSPLSRILIAVVRFLWGPNQIKQTAAAPGSGLENAPSIIEHKNPESGLFQEVLGWIMIVLATLACFLFLIIIFRLIIRFLFKKSGRQTGQSTFSIDLRIWLEKIKRIRQSLSNCLGRLFHSPDCAGEFYSALKKWGKTGGLRSIQSETPLEYGYRLAQTFPGLRSDFLRLINLINLELYGDRPLSTEQKKSARHILRVLSLPIYWPQRLKSWFLSPSILRTSHAQIRHNR